MIANKGYVPLSRLYEIAYWQLHEGAKDYLRETTPSILGLWLDRPADIARRWLVDFCNDHLFMTDGVGDPIKIDPALLTTIHYYVDLSRQKIDLGHRKEFSIPEKIEQLFDFCKPLSNDEIDRFNEAAEASNHAESEEESDAFQAECTRILDQAMEKFGNTRPYLFVETLMFSVNLSLYDAIKDIEHIDIQKVTGENADRHADVLRRFDGYFLVTLEARATKEWESYSHKISEQCIKEDAKLIGSDSEDGSLRGRPRKQEAALSAYMKALPGGHAGMTWKEVESIISSKIGERVSAQTIKAAIKSSEKGDD